MIVESIQEYENCIKETCLDMASVGNRASSSANSNLVRSLQGYKQLWMNSLLSVFIVFIVARTSQSQMQLFVNAAWALLVSGVK